MDKAKNTKPTLVLKLDRAKPLWAEKPQTETEPTQGPKETEVPKTRPRRVRQDQDIQDTSHQAAQDTTAAQGAQVTQRGQARNN